MLKNCFIAKEFPQKNCVVINSNAKRMAKKLFVGNLSWSIGDTELEETFAQFGAIDEAVVIKERGTDRSKGFGFVTFAEEDAADAAIEEMDGKEVDGRPINVNEARPMQPRE